MLDHLLDDTHLDDLLSAIAERVGQLIEENPDLLFSYLYRLDIEEGSIKSALRQENPIQSLALLIYDRQLLRYRSKKNHKSQPLEDWDW